MKSLKGHLLVATPELLDPNFHKTVVLMFEHNEQGAAGVVINRPIEATVSDIAEQVFQEHFEWEKSLSLGGPVSGPLMLLHSEADLADQEILPGVFSTIEADKVREILRRRADPCLIVANYAGWGPGQLESEIAQDSWITTPASPDLVFQADVSELWETVFEGKGAQPNILQMLRLKEVPDDPTLN